MKRAFAVFAMLIATTAFADDYDDGVAAVQAKDYGAAIAAFRKAITQAPVETPTYLPHYWIGVAKFHNGDINGALQHWSLSQAQGAIKKTPQFAQMKDYIARAESEKQKRAAAESNTPKKGAEAAMSRAIAKQSEAIAARRDRSETYRSGQRLLQEANAEYRKGSYAAAAKLANEATELFSGGSSGVVLFEDEPPQKPEVITKAEADAVVAAQKEKQRKIEKPERKPEVVSTETTATVTATALQTATAELIVPVVEPKKPNLEPAYRAYARGDLASSEDQLTKIITTTPSAEAFLLRGCARFTKAILTRGKTDAAAADFREALKRNTALKLDEKAFSPKLVDFFDKIRNGR